MPAPAKTTGPQSFGLLAARLPVGVLFVLKGYEKLKDQKVADFVSKHLGEVPGYMPPWFGKPFLTALPFAELLLGVFILTGFLSRVSGLLASCLLVSFLMIVGVHDPSKTWPFHPNFFFLGVTLLLLFSGGGSYGVDGRLFNGKAGGGGGGGGAPRH